jgi:hypothetical protein
MMSTVLPLFPSDRLSLSDPPTDRSKYRISSMFESLKEDADLDNPPLSIAIEGD